MMMFFAVTKPKKKLFLMLKLVLLAVLIGLVVPSIYYGLADAGAMESFMQSLNGEIVNVDGSPANSGQPVVLTAAAENLKEIIQADAVPGEPIRVAAPQEGLPPKGEVVTTDEVVKASPQKQSIIAKLRELILGEQPQIQVYSK